VIPRGDKEVLVQLSLASPRRSQLLLPRLTRVNGGTGGAGGGGALYNSQGSGGGS